MDQIQEQLERISDSDDARAALATALPVIVKGLGDKLFNVRPDLFSQKARARHPR